MTNTEIIDRIQQLKKEMIAAVSAIKCTPQNTMMSASVLPASCDSPRESPK